MQRQSKSPRAISKGFTLIELMVAVAVVAILGTIAMVTYTKQIQKSRRTDARSAILDLAGREEKLFSTTNAYGALPSDLGYAVAGAPNDVWPITIGSGYYQVTVTVTVPAAPNPPTYLIVANTFGTQVNDTGCTSFSVDQLGSQTAAGTDAATCWGN
jgi:type IV pilus assembly protein PilE